MANNSLFADDCVSNTAEQATDHPFWIAAGIDLADRPLARELPARDSWMTPSGRWTEAKWLRVDDHFLTKSGKSATVVGLTIRVERMTVYNLLVADEHNYLVGGDVLVHNGCRGKVKPSRGEAKPGRGNKIKQLYKEGWEKRPPTKGNPNTWFFTNPKTGAELRIMPGVKGSPSPRTPARNLGKYNTPWYYRYRPQPKVNPKWGDACPLGH